MQFFSPPPRRLAKGIAIIAMASLSLFGCKKDSDILEGQNPSVSLKSQLRELYDFTDYPTVGNGGMLCFRDDAHKQAYEQFLNSAITFSEDNVDSEGNIDTTGNDPDDILDVIENSMGFVSLRTVTNTNFEVLSEQGWADYREIPEKHFINSIVSKSILNAQADVLVGDKVTHFINEDYAVSVDADQSTLLDQFHALTENISGNDILDIDRARDFSQLIPLNGGIIGSTSAKTTNMTGGVVSINNIQNGDCGTINKIIIGRVDYFFYYPTGANATSTVSSDFIIDWGDGSTPQTFINRANGKLENISHVYPATGLYIVSAYARATGTGSNYEGPATKALWVPTCGVGKKNNREIWAEIPNTNKMLKGRVWIEQDYSFWARSKESRFGASTSAWEKRNNKWYPYRGERVATYCLLDKYNDNCSLTGTYSAYSGNNFSRSSSTEVNNSHHFGWSTIISTHRLKINGQLYGHDIVMDHCN